MKVFEVDEAYGLVLDPLEERKKKFCFIVFSSREDHIEVIIDWVEQVLGETKQYDTRRLDESLKSEDSQYSELRDLLHECSFSVVILDGLRPNVIFEYGILKGLGKPCIVLLEKNANVDILNCFDEDGSVKLNELGIRNPRVDLDKHFSDVKDRYCIRYDKYQPKETREKIRKAFVDLKEEISQEFVRLVLPDKDFLKKELKGPLSELSKIVGKEEVSPSELRDLKRLTARIDGILAPYEIRLVPKYYLEVAFAYIRAGKPEEALAKLNSVIEESYEFFPLIGLKSDILVSLDRLDEAMETAEDGLKMKPDEVGFWQVKGHIHFLRRNYSEAVKCLRKGIEIDKNDSLSHYYLGASLLGIKETKMALGEYEEALRLDPEEITYMNGKARALVSLGRREEASKIAHQIISRDPKSTFGYDILAQVADSYEERLPYVEKILELSPNDIEMICWKANILTGLKRYSEALPIFERILKECPPEKHCHQMRIAMSSCLYDAGRVEDALRLVDEALRTDNRDILALNMKAVILGKLGQQDESLKYLDTAIAISPRFASAYYNKSCALARKGLVKESIEVLRKSIKMNPKYEMDMRTDPDFDGIRNLAEFKSAFG